MGGNPGGAEKTMNRKSNQRSRRRRREESDGATEPTVRTSNSDTAGKDQPNPAPHILYFPA